MIEEAKSVDQRKLVFSQSRSDRVTYTTGLDRWWILSASIFLGDQVDQLNALGVMSAIAVRRIFMDENEQNLVYRGNDEKNCLDFKAVRLSREKNQQRMRLALIVLVVLVIQGRWLSSSITSDLTLYGVRIP